MQSTSAYGCALLRCARLNYRLPAVHGATTPAPYLPKRSFLTYRCANGNHHHRIAGDESNTLLHGYTDAMEPAYHSHQL